MNREVKKNYLFLGFAIPDEEMGKVFSIDNFPQIQTHKFNWNLIRGLEHFNEFDFTYVSARPVTDYPIFPQKKIKKNKWDVSISDKKISIQEIPFSNYSLLKLATRFFFALFYSLKNYCLKPNKAGVIVYSVYVPYMVVGLIISKIYKVDYIAIWTDPPAIQTNKGSNLKEKLRKIELKLSKYLMKKATKVIVLTKYLAEDFAPGKPYLVIEGIINANDIDYSQRRESDSSNKLIKFVYTGSLEKRYGIKNIVEGFILAKSKNAVLEIYGRGDYEDELLNITNKHRNIIYKGFVKNSEILKVQREADFLINARSSDDEYVKYSFPSKTLEYMLSGTPLITTMLPGIPLEYKDYVVVLDNNTPEVIAKKLNEVQKYSGHKCYQIGLRAQSFAESRDYIKQSKKIIEFIDV